MKRLIAILALLPLLAMGGGQNVMTGNHRHVFAASGSAPTFYAYTYAPSSGSGSQIASITSSTTITTSVGDLAVVMCVGGTYYGTTSFTVSSSISGSWVAKPFTTSSGGWTEQTFYEFVTTGGATSFTCTGNPSGSNWVSLVAIAYHNPGTFNTSVSNSSSASASSFTSATFSPGQRTLNIFCASDYVTGRTYSAGAINGNTATLRGVSASSLTSSAATSACEDYISTSSMSGATATMSVSPAATDWRGTVLALNY
jgi:hypothetical protein